MAPSCDKEMFLFVQMKDGQMSLFLFSLTRARCLSDHCVANVTVGVPEDGEAKLLTHRHSVSQTFRPRTFVEQMSSSKLLRPQVNLEEVPPAEFSPSLAV